jgi:hypothetical protein
MYVPSEPEKALHPLELELRMVVSHSPCVPVLETDPELSARAAKALSLKAVFLVMTFNERPQQSEGSSCAHKEENRCQGVVVPTGKNTDVRGRSAQRLKEEHQGDKGNEEERLVRKGAER